MSELLFNANEVEHVEELDTVQLVGMKLGGEEYGIDVLKIQEIIRVVDITMVPRSENYILGVMNRRGQVVPVIDLRVRFNFNKFDFDDATRIIVVRFDKGNVGFIVDEVTEIFRINSNFIEQTPGLVGGIGQEYVLGVCKFNERLIILLDIDRVVIGNVEHADSALRRKFVGSQGTGKKGGSKGAQKAPAVKAPKAAAPAPVAEAPAPAADAPAKYSMADEADAAASFKVTPAPAANAESDILTSVAKQAEIPTNAASLVEQGELDALIAVELAKREAETDELNKARKAAASAPAPVAAKAENVDISKMSIDEQIAMELAKREAETEELNKRHKEEEEKKNSFVSEKADETANEQPVNKTAGVALAADSAPLTEGKGVVSDDSLEQLKEVARKIIAGESVDIDTSVKGELGEIVNILMDLKGRVDELSPSVLSSKDELPGIASMLTNVDNVTGKAVIELIGVAREMSAFYDGFKGDLDKLYDIVSSEDVAMFNVQKDNMHSKVKHAGELGMRLLESLEFQDITEQQLRRVIKSVEEIGARLGTVVGFMKSKDGGNSDYDNVLTDLGFA